MSKQTALEWFASEIAGDLSPSYGPRLQGIFEQALQMEREQIEEAYGDGINAHRVDFCNKNEYYERTYGKEAGHEA